MGSAFEWIGKIAEWFGQFIPRWIILDPRTGGVKYVKGSRVVELKAGVHWYWPATTTYDTYPTVRQTDNLVSQTIVTLDSHTVTVGAMVVYDVFDVVKLLTTVHNAVHAIQDISLTAIHDVICNLSWVDLMTEQRRGTLDTKLKNAAKKQLADYGVNVQKCMLTDLTNKTRVLRVIQTTSTDS